MLESSTYLIGCLIVLGALSWQCKGTKDTASTSSASLIHNDGWVWADRELPAPSSEGEENKQEAPPLEREYILHFSADGSAKISLDINSCFGQYRTGEEGKIVFGEDLESGERGIMACTEACCDGPKASGFVRQVCQSSSFEVKGDQLILYQGDTSLKFTRNTPASN